MYWSKNSTRYFWADWGIGRVPDSPVQGGSGILRGLHSILPSNSIGWVAYFQHNDNKGRAPPDSGRSWQGHEHSELNFESGSQSLFGISSEKSGLQEGIWLFIKKQKFNRALKDLELVSAFCPDNLQITAMKIEIETMRSKNKNYNSSS